MTVTLTTKAFKAGDWGMIEKGLMYQGWLDSELSRSLPFTTWFAYQQGLIDSQEHAQVLLHVDGKCVGGVMLFETLDAQVGPAVIALHQFILPEYRAVFPYRKVIREAERVARECGSKFLIWTHRKPSGRIFYTYKEV